MALASIWERSIVRGGLVLALLLAGMLGASFAGSEHIGHAAPTTEQGAKSATQRLLALGAEYRAASPDRQAVLLPALESAAQQRAAGITQLAVEDPGALLRIALPASLRQSLPLQIQPDLEEQTTVDGTLEVIHSDDFTNRVATFNYYLVTPSGQRIGLRFAQGEPTQLSGAVIRANGVRAGDQLALASNTAGSYTVVSSSTTAQTGAKTVATILFNFQNNATQPFAPSYAQDVVFTATTSARAYYQESSFGTLSIGGKLDPVNGDVFGWYTISSGNTSCDYSTWASQANTAAQAAGVSLSGYTNIIYMFPKTSACSWSGLGTLGGSQTWINGLSTSLLVGVTEVAHELGHNFGAHHANRYVCTDTSGQRVAISSACSSVEYGDAYDVMGSSANRQMDNHPNNFHKGQEGFLNAGNTLAVTTAGTYTLAPQETSTSGVQVIRVPRSSSQYYYLEYRQPAGVFDQFGTEPNALESNVTAGVTIRLGPAYSTTTQSLLLDTTPNTYSIVGTDFHDPALTVGRTFTDPSTGVNVTTLSADASGASVKVAFGGATCVAANPVVGLTPAGQWGTPGQTVSYTLSVTNNDGTACPTSTFAVSPSLPAGWTQSPASVSLPVVPGGSAMATVQITSPGTAPADFYNLTETAVASATGSSGSASASYNIAATSTSATPSSTPTAVASATSTPVATATATSTPPPTSTPTSTPQATATSTPTASATSTPLPTSTPTTTSHTFSGTIASGGQANQPITVSTLTASLTWTGNATLGVSVLDPSGQPVAATSGKSKPQTITYNATTPGTYTLVLTSMSGRSASYVLTVSTR
jgi:hypothetical protein